VGVTPWRFKSSRRHFYVVVYDYSVEAYSLLRSARERRGLSIRALAGAAEVAPSTVHRIEQGDMEPTVQMLQRLLETMGFRLGMSVETDYAVSIAGLFDSAFEDIERDDVTTVLRKTSEFVARFLASETDKQRLMISVEPETSLHDEWDAFAAGLAEWLAVIADVSIPPWAHNADRYLNRAWWITNKKSLQAWEYAGTPASLQQHGVYVHRDSLVNV
jgi:transcriptional regulator with XRE-family HTH domain